MKMLIVAAGKLPANELINQYAEESDFCIAVDGGLCAFEHTSIVPNLIVGDMDSVDSIVLNEYLKKGSEAVFAEAEKNETDSMLALDIAIKRGATKIVMLGATGGRIDHLLSNIMLLKRAHKKNIELVMEDKRHTISIGKGDFDIKGKKGQTVSLIPINDSVHVTASGLYYPLENLRLTNDKPRGVSNLFLRETAHIKSDRYVLVIKIKEPIKRQ
ncbi:MAG: thiamine diphosphokinase [Christensenellaceae bacterium]